MKYDDASWHYERNYPKDLPVKNAATHIGMFLKWCICKGFASDDLKEDCEEDIQKVISGEMSGAEFLIYNCDERFLDEDLSEEGQKFANDYYEEKTEFSNKFNSYYKDYFNLFDHYKTLYHVEDTRKNYDLIAEIISERFNQWKSL